MRFIEGNLFDYAKDGVIVHQVNCQNTMESGFAKEFFTRYPVVKSEFHDFSSKLLYDRGMYNPLLGEIQWINIDKNLYAVNSFTQEYYKNGKIHLSKFTDEKLLIRNIGIVLDEARDRGLDVFIPKYIGCGLAGGDWRTVLEGIEKFNTSHLNIIGFR